MGTDRFSLDLRAASAIAACAVMAARARLIDRVSMAARCSPERKFNAAPTPSGAAAPGGVDGGDVGGGGRTVAACRDGSLAGLLPPLADLFGAPGGFRFTGSRIRPPVRGMFSLKPPCGLRMRPYESAPFRLFNRHHRHGRRRRGLWPRRDARRLRRYCRRRRKWLSKLLFDSSAADRCQDRRRIQDGGRRGASGWPFAHARYGPNALEPRSRRSRAVCCSGPVRGDSPAAHDAPGRRGGVRPSRS